MLQPINGQLFDTVTRVASLPPVALNKLLDNATGIYGVFDERGTFRGVKVVFPYNGMLIWVDASVGELSGTLGGLVYAVMLTREQTAMVNSRYMEMFPSHLY